MKAGLNWVRANFTFLMLLLLFLYLYYLFREVGIPNFKGRPHSLFDNSVLTWLVIKRDSYSKDVPDKRINSVSCKDQKSSYGIW
jgi:hypothetical protein